MEPVHGGRVYEYAEALGRDQRAILDFSANINPLGPPNSVYQAIVASLDGIRHYPDMRHRAIKDILARRFAVARENLLCGNGATEVMELLFRHLRPKRIFIFEPAFAEYAAIGKRIGAEIVSIPLDLHSEPLCLRDITPMGGDLVVVNNPHNPTGQCFAESILWPSVTRFSAAGAYVLVDESFLDFRADGDALSAIPWTERDPRIVVVRSATKMYSIPGLRFGFAVGDAELLDQIERDRDGWSVNHLAQAAACAAYQDEEFAQQTWSWLAEEQSYVEETWGKHLRVHLFKPSVNFFLVRFDGEKRAREIQVLLSQNGIFVRSCANFSGLGMSYTRIAIRKREENERLWQLVSNSLS